MCPESMTKQWFQLIATDLTFALERQQICYIDIGSLASLRDQGDGLFCAVTIIGVPALPPFLLPAFLNTSDQSILPVNCIMMNKVSTLITVITSPVYCSKKNVYEKSTR